MRRKPVFAFVILILAMLACNLPNAGTPEAPAPAVTATTQAEITTEEAPPTATPQPTETPPPTETPLPPAEITLTKNSNCRLGPNNTYVVIDQISMGAKLPVIARNEANTWWQVVNATSRECWIFNENATPSYDFSSLGIGSAPPLPGVPVNFMAAEQVCQSGQQKFTVTVRWASGGGEKSFRLFRDGNQIIEVKAGKFNFKDERAPYNRNIMYEIESVNENGTSERAALYVPACK